MDKSYEVAVGSAAIDDSLPFAARSVTIQNPTNQWVRLESVGGGIFVPQYTLGATYRCDATTRARFSFTAPQGQVEPPIIAGQFVTVTFDSSANPESSGVGMLGGRAPYYDRNPLSIVRGGSATALANSGVTPLWTYTVPAGRKAFLEACTVLQEITTAYANDNALIQTVIRCAPSGGGATPIIIAQFINGVALGTRDSTVLGSNMELQAGDVVNAQAADLRAAGAGATFHEADAKFTEFDA